jgi:hypothetical protein
MTRLEELTPGSRLEGLIASGAITVLQAQFDRAESVQRAEAPS